MAEAHQATAFSFSLTHEGVNFNYDAEVLHVIWLSGLRSYRKRFIRAWNKSRNGVYPSSIENLLTIISITFICRYIFNLDISCGIINWLSHNFIIAYLSSWFKFPPIGCDLLACISFTFGFWLLLALFMRYTLKLLFMYKGWMYDARGGMSTKTKLWLAAVRLLTRKIPKLYSFQASLPRLPLPPLEQTMRKYLRSVRPLCKTDEEYERIVKLSKQFESGIAKKLQRYLSLKSWWASNYVSDWWEEYVYLRGRAPIMVNSNFYAMDSIGVPTTHRPTARAANLVYSCLLFRRLIDRQELKPIIVQGTVPLCSWQYERMFNTTRIPGLETDTLVHLDDSRHIAVFFEGKYFKVNIYHKGKLLLPKELEIVFEAILENKSKLSPGEENLSSLTATDRITWAKARKEYFSKGINKMSLDQIEKAAFVLIFENENLEYDKNDPTKLDKYGQILLHGKGNDRWYDKSFNLIVGKNCRAGLNGEHSWADAPIIAHLWEYALSNDITNLGYDDDGKCKVGNSNIVPPAPVKLKWDFNEEICSVLDQSFKTAQSILSDVDLKLLVFEDYGKGFMKKCKVSPDAYLQMALQLAYFRDTGEFSLTYEASMTRLYREGRTETVRPVSIESATWVRAMNDPSKTHSELLALFRHACTIHQKAYQEAMCGKGIDRHLFCLYVVSKYLEVDSPFLREVLSEPWKLSTSQTPHGQAGLIDFRKYPEHVSAGGGFGPVADDGYGVSYIVAGEGMVFFHISSKRSSDRTESTRFSNNVKRVLNEMKAMFETEFVTNK